MGFWLGEAAAPVCNGDMGSVLSAERRVLGLFAKRPTPGHVKTRLAAATSPAWAAEVAAAFLADLLDRLAAIEARRVIAFTPLAAESYFNAVGEARFELVPQGDGDLGRRLERFVGTQLGNGVEAVVVVGADSPTLPIAFIEQAFEQLATADLVLGPAMDGGYYLLGCARRVPAIFDRVAWGGSMVLAEAIARIHSSCRLALLPPWYDVDTLDDWRMLCGHLAALRRAGLDPGVPRTEQLCRSDPR